MTRKWLFLGLFACGTDATFDLLPVSDAAPNDAASSETDTGACGACPCGLTMCNGACVDLQRDPSNCHTCNASCSHNQWCNAAQCECLQGFTLCGTSCFDLASDPDHCGGCNATPCMSGEKCENSVCGAGPCSNGKLSCSISGRTQCAAQTVPFCNACGVTCAPAEVCTPNGCARYAPATPCTSCPCTSDCARALPNSTCCPGTNLGGAICVEGTTCP